MDLYFQFMILIIIILACVMYLSASKGDEIYENFETYTYGPFNFRTTGSDPLTFYQYPTYRKPFMYPYQYVSSYPYPHLTYWTNSL